MVSQRGARHRSRDRYGRRDFGRDGRATRRRDPRAAGRSSVGQRARRGVARRRAPGRGVVRCRSGRTGRRSAAQRSSRRPADGRAPPGGAGGAGGGAARGGPPRGRRAPGGFGAATGATCFSETFPARAERGGGLPDIDRLPYFPEPALAALAGRRVVLAGALAPVTYFGYEGIPGELARPEDIVTLATPGDAADDALEALADRIGAAGNDVGVHVERWRVEDGPLTPQAVGRVLANALPDDAIVSIEGGTCGYPFVTASARARRHTILTNTGGAIGQGLPVALGAAVACPERRVFALQSDGSAQYTIQSLWTMARERLPIVMLIASNRRYGILQTELARSGLPADTPHASRLTQLDDPPIDWLALSRGYGVPAQRVSDVHVLAQALDDALAHTDGPTLIEMQLS
nr:acetolactate synthase large subunit [Burkholderia contaminans]